MSAPEIPEKLLPEQAAALEALTPAAILALRGAEFVKWLIWGQPKIQRESALKLNDPRIGTLTLQLSKDLDALLRTRGIDDEIDRNNLVAFIVSLREPHSGSKRPLETDPITPAVETFWKAVATSGQATTFTHGENEGKKLTIAAEDPSGPGGSTTEILVRQCYETAYSKIMDPKASRAFFVTGTSGIGKSTMIIYFINRLLREDPTWQIFCELPKFVVKITSGEVLFFLPSNASFLATALANPKCLYFIDASTTPTSPLELPTESHRVILFASSGSGMPKSFSDFYTMRGLGQLTLPLWTSKEIALARCLAQYMSIPGELIDSGIRHWGLVPRRVLGHAGLDRSHEKLFDSAILAWNLADITAVPAGEDRKNLKYALVHRTADEELCYTGLRFCSELAATQLSQRYFTGKRKEVADWVTSATKPELAGVRGNLFEPFIHRELETSGEHKYKVRKLADAPAAPAPAAPTDKSFHVTSSAFPSNLLEKSIVESKAVYTVHLPDSLAMGAYVHPKEKNFPSVDSLLISKDEISLFQVTVSLHHGVKAHYLNLVLAELCKLFPDHPIRLYFVSPVDVFPDLRAQPYYNTDGKVAKTLDLFPHVKNVEQFALAFPLGT